MMADQDQRKERKRVQNREAQRTYSTSNHSARGKLSMANLEFVASGSRMKKRVEDLEREVTTLRQQVPGHHYDLPTHEAASEDQNAADGGVTRTYSDAAVVTNVIEAVSVPADDQRTDIRNRKRLRRAAAVVPDSLYEELVEMGVKDSTETGNHGSTAERNPSESLSSSSRCPVSHSRFGSEVVASISQAKSPRPQHKTVPQDRATSVSHAGSQGFAALLSEELSLDAEPPLLSPSSSSMSTGAYYNPSFFSQAGQWPAAPPFPPWPFSPPLSTMGTYPGVPFPGYHFPLHQPGQDQAGQVRPWPHSLGEHEASRDTFGQQGSLSGEKIGARPTRETDPQPAAANTRNAANELISPIRQAPDSPTNSDVEVPLPASAHDPSKISGMRQPSDLFQGKDDDGDMDIGLDSDLEMTSTSSHQTPELSQMPDVASPSPDKFADALLWELRLQNKELMGDLSSILQKVLDRIRAGDSRPDKSSGTQGSNGTRVVRGREDKRAAKPPPMCNESLEDRLEFIRLCVAAAGFSSIDDMVGQYYTADFRQDSLVARQQRISRHTQLPHLFVQLRSSSQTWTQWEAHGYQSEIMKSAVTLIQNEREAFSAPRHLLSTAQVELQKALSEDLTAGAGGSSASRRPPSSSGALQHLLKSLQDTMPKLWLFTEELENVNGSQRQRLYTSLATVLLLCCVKGVPNSETRALAIGCLSIANK